jgi:hypothetical protein
LPARKYGSHPSDFSTPSTDSLVQCRPADTEEPLPCDELYKFGIVILVVDKIANAPAFETVKSDSYQFRKEE